MKLTKPVTGPLPVKKQKVVQQKPPHTAQQPRPPIEALKEMEGLDISRHERAEEAMREHFRQYFEKIGNEHKIDKSA